MRTMIILVAVLSAGLTVAASDPAQAEPRSVEHLCHEHPQLVGKCFTIRGRMSYYNGTPSVRIWRIGTTRILGVSEGRFKIPGFVNLPRKIESKLSLHTDLFGDFVVCPFTPDEPGVMRLVCVDSAKDLKVRPKKRGDK